MGTLGQLNTERFARAISLAGAVPAAWYRRDGECPACHADERGFVPNVACTLCGGVGMIYTEMELPTTGDTGGKLLLQQAMIGKTRAPIELRSGDLICSYMPDEYPLEEGDRIVLASREVRMQERIERGTGVSDRLRQYPVIRIDSVYTASGEVESGYSVGADERTIAWSGGPAAGTQYTVSYWHRPVYYVPDDAIHRRVEATNGDPFPYRAVLRLWREGSLDVKSGGY